MTTKTKPSAPRPAPRCFNHARTRTTQGHASRGATVDKNRAKRQCYSTPHPNQNPPRGSLFLHDGRLLTTKTKPSAPGTAPRCLNHARTRTTRGHASRGATVDKNRVKRQCYSTPHPNQNPPRWSLFLHNICLDRSVRGGRVRGCWWMWG